ncbi:putative retinoblastoma-like protein 1 isoform a [Operophtera brumata]|uniref:V-type proton ATPase proteolipid subunit n=1 Tax=Operophtera brumata TaxID=104452 RepID=A0A0L7KMA4_OPEBR|nr:putative retinoblastoma-like protein 1 isoform a [Operophtera brumata]
MSSTEESVDHWISEMDSLCSNLNVDPAAAEKSKESFLDIKRNFTLDGDVLHWMACALYVACRTSITPTVESGNSVEGNCVSLTKLLRLCNISLIQFFTKIKNWMDMTSMSTDFKNRISRLEHKFAVSTVLYRKFQPIFQEIFQGLKSDEPLKMSSTKTRRPKIVNDYIVNKKTVKASNKTQQLKDWETYQPQKLKEVTTAQETGMFPLPAMGAAYGTAKSGTGIAAMAVKRPELIMKSVIPVVMAGIIAIYGLVVAVLIAGALDKAPDYTLYKFELFLLFFFSCTFTSLTVCPDKPTLQFVTWTSCQTCCSGPDQNCKRKDHQGNRKSQMKKHIAVDGSVSTQSIAVFLAISRGYIHLSAGLAVGFSGMAAGFSIGVVGDAGVRATAQQPKLFVGMILILIFAEVLGLYGLIVAIFLYTK